MEKLAPDIFAQLQKDFPADQVAARVQQVLETTSNERLQRCIVFAGRGHPWYFDYLCRMYKTDYRDVILIAEYDRLGARLYNFGLPIPEARIDEPYK
jgi:hypothetical protein